MPCFAACIIFPLRIPLFARIRTSKFSDSRLINDFNNLTTKPLADQMLSRRIERKFSDFNEDDL